MSLFNACTTDLTNAHSSQTNQQTSSAYVITGGFDYKMHDYSFDVHRYGITGGLVWQQNCPVDEGFSLVQPLLKHSTQPKNSVNHTNNWQMRPLQTLLQQNFQHFGQLQTIDNIDALHKALQYAKALNITIHLTANQLNTHAGLASGALAGRMGLKPDLEAYEAISLYSLLQLIEYTGVNAMIHDISTQTGVELIAQAKLALSKKGQSQHLKASCAVHHLAFQSMDIMHYHTLYKYQPPLRGLNHQKALWQGLQEGVLDYVTSNHTLASYVNKQEPFAIAQSGGPHAFILIPWLLTMATQLNIKIEQALSWVGSQIIAPLNTFNSETQASQPLYCLQNIANVWQNHLNLQYPSAMHGREFTYTIQCMPKNTQESLKILQSSLG